MKKLMFNITACLKYFKNNLIFTLILFIASLLSGVIIFHSNKIPINPVSPSFNTLLLNNLLVCLTIIFSGIISFGFFGNFVLIANSVFLGRVIVGVYNMYGISPILKYLAPHFIFEITALLIATAISQETNKFFYNFRHTDIRVIRIKYDLIALLIMLTLLCVAAFIESQL
ncbi:stage II sporulation protein M [Streptococcus saliviloxodontae]|uniref:Membrane protein SpoIIM required for sporulation n=1 Tax=Streptococcus saliviloxodontae TaxID=1349416 RepID=A0ABS2PKS8_9STRE|nr:stage II sporulation protein M [Streptococcus saliviloxodontae]MBM7636037.1 putative membrane protein SpoIIM required for sporulation [Streptococcus saliviloxodontae]